MSNPPPPTRQGPSLRWRLGSTALMALTGALSKAFLYGLNSTETTGLSEFVDLLDQRRRDGRRRGLVTVCNHVSVLDDPLMWGVLPLRLALDPSNIRWGLGAHDICFGNRFTSAFFSLGQVLPTYRLLHSPHGGLFQPVMSQAIHILSRQQSSPSSYPGSTSPWPSIDLTKPPSSGAEVESLLGPSVFASNHLGWVHVFPEGRVIQNPTRQLAYFRWGVARLILEAQPVPDVVPMFLDGTQQVMPEDRGWPQWAPRVGASVRVVFGKPLDVEAEFGEHRARWRQLCEDENRHSVDAKKFIDHLRHGDEASKLRIEVAGKVREHVLGLGKSVGGN